MSVARVCRGLVRSRLFADAEVASLMEEWRAAAPRARDSSGDFARWLLTNRRVTLFQLQHLLGAHPRRLVIGGYRLVERLGKGDLGKVYKALAPDGTLVALKTLPPSRGRDPRWVYRFVHEAQVMRRLRHPNVVCLRGAGVDEGLYFIAMDLVQGESLEQILAQRRLLPPAEACQILFQALEGLDYLFVNGLAHGNLKPANLLLAEEGPANCRPGNLGATLKILDVGLGPVVFQDLSLAAAAKLRKEGLGTPPPCVAYLAPELVKDPWHVDIRADLFSLGCILYRCLTGCLPFPAANGVAQILRMNLAPPRPLKDFDPRTSGLLQEALDRMLAVEPTRRFATPRQALEALSAVMLQIFV